MRVRLRTQRGEGGGGGGNSEEVVFNGKNPIFCGGISFAHIPEKGDDSIT